MKNAKKTLLVAAIIAVAGLAVYLYTSLTGYLASASLNTTPVVCTVIAAVLLYLASAKLTGITKDVAAAVSGVLLLVSLYQFVLARVSLAADVYFIPVNYPAAEATALHISLVGVALYLVAYIVLIVSAFTADKGSEA